MLLSLALGLAAAAPSTAPVVAHDAPPAYPDEARARGLEGTVVLTLEVDAQGQVTEAEVTDGVDPALDAAALAAARQLRFLPATRDGVAVASQVRYRYLFRLGASETGGIARPATLHAAVRDPDGLPIPGAVATLQPIEPAGEPSTRRTDATGAFDVGFTPPGRYRLTLDAPAFQPTTLELTLGPGQVLSSTFTLVARDALEVVVWADRETWRDIDRGALVPDPGTVTGYYELTRRDIESTPGSMEDVARAAHVLPGVVSDGDLLAGFHVRGGEQSDVVYLLDRVPLENPFHLAGFNSLFNPDLIERVGFYAGAAPADVPSATSAVMDVTTWDGSPKEPGGGVDGAIDLSASSARALVMGPLDADERFTVALAARRTYMEGYFQVLKLANVIDSAFSAPEFSELSARAAWRPSPRTRVMATALRTGDSLALIDSGDDALVNFQGAFELNNRLGLLSLDHRYTAPSGFRWQTTLAGTDDRSYQRRELAGTLERETTLRRAFLRTDAVLPLGPNARVEVGGDVSRFRLAASGQLEDKRAQPTWMQAGIADFGLPLVSVDNNPAPWVEANAYAQTQLEAPLGAPVERGGRTLQPAVRVRAGLRMQYAGLTDELLPSPRAGVSVPLPTGTIPKLSYGLYQRVLRDPIQLAPGFGQPSLRAERARHLVAGVDQGFALPGEGTGGLVRLELYDIQLRDLVTNPDTAEAVTRDGPYANVGSGRNRGADLMVAARMGRLNAQLAYGLLYATRTNPLNQRWQQALAPPQDQRHTLAVAADYQLFAHWRFTVRYAAHSGRPVSRVDVADPVAGTVALGCLNCDRLGPTHQVDVRAEWRRAYARYRLMFYAEVLNVGNIQSDFLPIHDVIDGALSTTMLAHLPMRPFLGLRADF